MQLNILVVPKMTRESSRDETKPGEVEENKEVGGERKKMR